MKYRYLLLLCFFITVSQLCRAQTSVSLIPQISDTYLDRLIELAKANYPRVKAYQTRIEVAKNNVSRSKLSYLDVLTISYVYQPHSATIVNVSQSATGGSSGTGTGTGTTNGQSYSYFNGIQAGLFFNLGGYLQKPKAIKQAKGELQIAYDEQSEYMLTLTTEVKRRYYNYVLKLNNVKFQTQSAQDAEELLKNVRHRFEKGEETYENYSKAQETFTTRNQSRMLSEADLLTAKAELEELIGDKIENVK
ncbi:TolC family protein [Mucilaginibacter sp. RS28]|uniref:TolC family protein n=1 Tax=Mucilaginibacter straminoryzae TaxID=2932774 RepID=A0A9X1X652_9SPHI|nr:TolC family protein [Mucilaginibacter straminoryzae]MCJ8211822.1 TolC family protein [Mucilaginibacter straminoryzae]